MNRILLPDDFITSSIFSTITQEEKIVGSGLEKRSDGIFAVVPGVLRETNEKLWIASSNKRYKLKNYQIVRFLLSKLFFYENQKNNGSKIRFFFLFLLLGIS